MYVNAIKFEYNYSCHSNQLKSSKVVKSRMDGKTTMETKVVKTNDGRWRLVSGVLALVSIGLLIAVIVLVAMGNGRMETPMDDKDMMDKDDPKTYSMCGQISGESDIDASEAEFPDMYDDLTMKELRAVQEYMYGLSEMKIVKPSEATVNSSYIYVSDLHPPKKSEAMAYLGGIGPKPNRTARLVVFRGDAIPPVVEEYIVGPLPNPTWHKLYTNSVRKSPVPYAFRPIGSVEIGAFYHHLFPEIDKKIGFLLTESYGATFTNCGDKCLTFFLGPVGSGILKEKTRKYWMVTNHKTEYYSVHPLDLLFLANVDFIDPTRFLVEKVVYAGVEYASLDDLATKYNTTSIPKSKVLFPEGDRREFSTVKQRGDPVPQDPKRAPQMIEPDGKRYSLKHRHVKYMQWDFNFRLSTLMGPQLFDIRFNKERIAYEIGLQEIAVFYAANNSATRSADFIDSGALIGTHSQSLVPGADCPESSTFIDLTYIGENSDDNPIVLDRAFCLFEHNSGVPLRRHLSYAKDEGAFYSGLSDNVLILRSIMTIVNYDYVMDYIFHQSGALEVRALSTGYIFTSFHSPHESPYGFHLHDNIIGNIHHHMFLFKADIDIHGTSNRYETLDISTEEVPNEQSTNDPSSTYFQYRFDRHLKQKEMDAAYKHSFDHPKYHVIHNQQYKTSKGELKSYRLHINGMAKLMLPEDIGNEVLVSWNRYQLTVTKFKEDEIYGSACYGMFGSMEPTVNFTSFIADDDNIMDEDLVLWIPMGVHHIPHTEDLPVTPTAGSHLSFTLLPYNYFPECPSSQSRDNIRVDYKDRSRPADGLRVERYGTPENKMCVAHAPDYEKYVRENPAMSLEYP